MTIEQIELRKILTQMLADNGINRETICDFVREAIDKKIDKAFQTILHETNIDKQVRSFIDREISNYVTQETRNMVRNVFSNIYVTVNCPSKQEDAYE